MKEISKYEVLVEKLRNICDENNLVYSIQRNAYPFLLTIRPVGGMDAQLNMLEDMDSAEDTGYISPDASIVFAYKDGVLIYKTSETFTISESLLSKIKNLFKNLHAMWMMYFFRNSMETGYYNPRLVTDSISAADEESEDDPGETDADDFPEDGVAPYADFMDSSASGLIEE